MLVSALAIMLLNLYSQGEWLSLREVLTTSPACWFWILWFALVFISADGFTKEYRSRLWLARKEYSSETGFSPTAFAFQFLPLLVDLAVFLRLRRLARSNR